MGKKKKIRQEIRAFRPFSVEKHGDMGYNGIRNDFGREPANKKSSPKKKNF